MAALARLVAWKLSIHGVPAQGTVALVSGGGSDNRYRKGVTVSFDRIAGHRDGCRDRCPGSALYAQLGDLRARAGAQAGTIAATPKLTLSAPRPRSPTARDAVLSGRFTQPDGRALPGRASRCASRAGAGRSPRWRGRRPARDGSWSARVAWRRAGAVRAEARAPVTGARVRSRRSRSPSAPR